VECYTDAGLFLPHGGFVQRIVKRKYAQPAFDGEGASRYPGRWNSRGTPMVYTAESRALALLEMLVHFENESLLREAFVVIAVTIPKDCIWRPPSFPEHWPTEPAGEASRAFGVHWVRQGTAAAMAVPSIIVPAETIYILNPRHPDFSRLSIGATEGLTVGNRLLG